LNRDIVAPKAIKDSQNNKEGMNSCDLFGGDRIKLKFVQFNDNSIIILSNES
jgi:hypothetical protein